MGMCNIRSFDKLNCLFILSEFMGMWEVPYRALDPRPPHTHTQPYEGKDKIENLNTTMQSECVRDSIVQ